MLNNPKLFPELDLRKLIKYATYWAEDHPLIEQISLYEASVESGVEYIFVVIFKMQTREWKEYEVRFEKIKSKYPVKVIKEDIHIRENFVQEKKALKKEYSDKYPGFFYYFNWASEECLHIINDIKNFYFDEPPFNYQSDWMWINTHIRESLDQGFVERGNRWILFNRSGTLKRQAPKDFVKKARLEIDKIYNEIRRKGLSNPKKIESTPESRHEAALCYYEQNKKRFKIIKKKHLNDINIYDTVEKIKRKIIGSILSKVVISEGYQPEGGQALYKISNKLLKD